MLVFWNLSYLTSISQLSVSLFMYTFENFQTLRGKSGTNQEMKFNVSNFVRSSLNLIKTPRISRLSPTLLVHPDGYRRYSPACGINGAADFVNSVMNSAPYYARRIHTPIHPSPIFILFLLLFRFAKPRRVMMAAMSRYAISAEIIL